MTVVDSIAGWDDMYSSRPRDALGWYEEVPATLPDVLRAAPSPACSILDVGAGASSLVEHLLDRGFDDITLLDISARALADAVRRVDRPIETIVADVRSFCGARRWDLWHDRATFHFLTTKLDRQRYMEVLDRSLAADGHVVIATFGLDGPERCAGLPVERYDIEALTEAFGDGFVCVAAREHRPEPGSGDRRPYVIATFRRRMSSERG